MNVVQDAERRFLPAMHALAAQINQRFEHVRAGIWSSPLGSLTEFQGHDLGVDCVIRDVPADHPGSIALQLVFCHLTYSPKVEAFVCWGYPSGYVDAEVCAAPVELSEATMATIEAAFPQLSAALLAALERGHPPPEAS